MLQCFRVFTTRSTHAAGRSNARRSQFLWSMEWFLRRVLSHLISICAHVPRHSALCRLSIAGDDGGLDALVRRDGEVPDVIRIERLALRARMDHVGNRGHKADQRLVMGGFGNGHM